MNLQRSIWDKSQKQKDEWNSNMLKERLYGSTCRGSEMHKIMLYADVATNMYGKFTWFTWSAALFYQWSVGGMNENEG